MWYSVTVVYLGRFYRELLTIISYQTTAPFKDFWLCLEIPYETLIMLKGFGNSKVDIQRLYNYSNVLKYCQAWVETPSPNSKTNWLFQFSVTDSQRDMVANYSRSERDKGEGWGEKRVNLNLFGNKFYSAKREKTNSSDKQNRQQGEGDWVSLTIKGCVCVSVSHILWSLQWTSQGSDTELNI